MDSVWMLLPELKNLTRKCFFRQTTLDFVFLLSLHLETIPHSRCFVDFYYYSVQTCLTFTLMSLYPSRGKTGGGDSTKPPPRTYNGGHNSYLEGWNCVWGPSPVWQDHHLGLHLFRHDRRGRLGRLVRNRLVRNLRWRLPYSPTPLPGVGFEL